MSVQVELPAGQFNNVIRMLHCAERERVLVLKTATEITLARLSVKRNTRKAISKTPAGSDQWDMGSVVAWMNKIKPTDTLAIQQLVAIDATVVSRTGV
jgi:hypothetical protein